MDHLPPVLVSWEGPVSLEAGQGDARLQEGGSRLSRPVSLTSELGKVLEQITGGVITQNVQDKQEIRPRQPGFVTGPA